MTENEPEQQATPIVPTPPVQPQPQTGKKVVIDREKSDKAIIEKSVLGQLLYSPHVCKDCGSPVLVEHWESCAKCGGKVAVLKEDYKPKPKTKKVKTAEEETTDKKE